MDNTDPLPTRREARALQTTEEVSRDLVLKAMDRANALVKEIQRREKQAPLATNLTVRVSTRTSTNTTNTCKNQCPTAAVATAIPSCKIERGNRHCEKRIHATANLTLHVSARPSANMGITNSGQSCSAASATTLPSTKGKLDKHKREKQVLSTTCLTPVVSTESSANSANMSKSPSSVEPADRTFTTAKIELETQQRQIPALVTPPLPSKSSTGTRTSTNNTSTGKSRCPTATTVTSIHLSKIVADKQQTKTQALTTTDLTSKAGTRAGTASTDTSKSRCPTATATRTIPSQSSSIPTSSPLFPSPSSDNIQCGSKINSNDNRSVGKGDSKKSHDNKSSIDKSNTMKPCGDKSNIDSCSAETNRDGKSKDKCSVKEPCDGRSNVDKCSINRVYDDKSNIDKCHTKKSCDDKSNIDKCNTKKGNEGKINAIIRKSCEVNSSTDKCNRDNNCSKNSNNDNNQSSKDKATANKTSSGRIKSNQSSNSNSKAINGKDNDKAIDDKSSHDKSSHKTPDGDNSLPLTLSSLSLLTSHFSSISLTKPHCCIRLKTPHPHLEYHPPTESTAPSVSVTPSVSVAPSAPTRSEKPVNSDILAASVAPTNSAKPVKPVQHVKSEKPSVPVPPAKSATKPCCVCIMSTGESSSALIVKPKPKRRTTFAPSSITSTSIAHPFSVSSSQCICGSECDALYDELSRNLADAEYEYKECICLPQSRMGALKKPTDPPENTRLQRFWYRAKDMEEYLRLLEDYIDEVEACLKEYVSARMRQREAVAEEQRRLRHELDVIKARAMLLGQGGDK